MATVPVVFECSVSAGFVMDPNELDFLIADYDLEAKAWFTALIPGQPLSGIITGKGSPQLNADMTPVPAKDGIDVNVYKVSIAIAPPHLLDDRGKRTGW